jgi:uncharacterized protein (DUF433 family)
LRLPFEIGAGAPEDGRGRSSHSLTCAVEPDRLQGGGERRIAGTRMRVTDILAMLAEGVSEEVILADFPYVELEDIRASLAYAASVAEERAHGGSRLKVAL